MFTYLVASGPTIELDRIRRFHELWEAAASTRQRRGDIDALTAYEEHDRLRGGVTAIDVQRAALRAWETHRRQGSVALMVATNESAAVLNRAVQASRLAKGEIDPNRYSSTAAGCAVHVGDQIVTRANDRRLRTDRGRMVRNRALWTVTDVNRDGSIHAHGPEGSVLFPADYVERHVQLGYAQTIHGAQGRTVDRGILVVDGPVDGHAAYVGLTRGAISNEAIVLVDSNRAPADVLGVALASDWTDTPAIVIRPELHQRCR